MWNCGYYSSLTPEPIELKLCMSDYVAHQTEHTQPGNNGFTEVSTAQGLNVILMA